MVQNLDNLKRLISSAFDEHFNFQIAVEDMAIGDTKKEFEGDFTFVVFPYLKSTKSSPFETAEKIGQYIEKHGDGIISGFNITSGFLNFSLGEGFWHEQLMRYSERPVVGDTEAGPQNVLVEFSSPNTNKPLHLGHIRNILLGWSVSQILEAKGHHILKTQIINDRGIAICKSIVAWLEFGNGTTPNSTNLKGDHFVGRYYRTFEDKFGEEYTNWQGTNEAKVEYETSTKYSDTDSFYKSFKNQYFNEYSALGHRSKEVLKKWEDNDKDIIAIWKKMNGWVYEGFNRTYSALGVEFDTLYYESDTYLLGKEMVEAGLKSGTFYRLEDGSVWVDLEDVGLDKKILLRSDGTSVYMTQDLGTAQLRYENHDSDQMIYVVGDEQDYHFQVLFEIMKKLNAPFSNGLYHLSYGMIDLPTGKMKSREGTVVDADDLIHDVVEEVRKMSAQSGELAELNISEKETIIHQIALAALKFFILRVHPKKRMTFNPQESVDIHGQTGPYIQNAYVRIKSVQRRAPKTVEGLIADYGQLHATEKSLIKSLMSYEETVDQAGENLDPSIIANFVYDLAKKYHKFYHEVRILNAEEESAVAFRLKLSKNVARTIEHSMKLLGIEMPDKM